MKALHIWNVTISGPIDEILEPLENTRQIIIAPIPAVLEGLLYLNINDKQHSLRNTHS